MTNKEQQQTIQKHWPNTKDFMLKVSQWAAKASVSHTTQDSLATVNEIGHMIASSDYTNATDKHMDLLNFIYNVRRLASIDRTNIKMSTIETIMQAIYHNLIDGEKLEEEEEEEPQPTEENQGDNMKQLTQQTEEMVRNVSQDLYLVSEEDVEDLVIAIERKQKLDPAQTDIIENLIYSANTNHEYFPDKGFDVVAEELESILI